MGKNYLETADQSIVDILLEQILPLAVLAGPTPHIVPVSFPLALIQQRRPDRPHHDVEEEECDREDGVVNGGLLRSLVTAPGIRVEDGKRESK